MTITELIRQMRIINNDTGTVSKKTDTYYTDIIILTLGDLETILGKIAFRTNKYQFVPMRDAERNILYDTDGVTPKIDPAIFYNPADPPAGDLHIPFNAIVNKGLTVKAGAAVATIESADFLDEFGFEIEEHDVAMVKIDVSAAAEGETEADFDIDISLDGRETWAAEDHGKIFSFEDDEVSTGYVDVSDLPSRRAAIKWTLRTGTIRSTVFERYYIAESVLRNYKQHILDLGHARILDESYKRAIENQNDPMVINGIKAQIDSLRDRYDIGKRGGNMKQAQGSSRAAVYFPSSKAEDRIMGYDDPGSELLADKRVVSLKSDGSIRRS